MTRPCKVGVQLPEVERFVSWPEYLDLARRVEAAGYDSIWVGDHLRRANETAASAPGRRPARNFRALRFWCVRRCGP